MLCLITFLALGIGVHACPPLGIDRAAFEAEYCDLEHWRGASGVQVYRNLAPPEELVLMQQHANTIPYPTRSLCGSSDHEFRTPEICTLPEPWARRRFPRTLTNLDEALGEWTPRTGEEGRLLISGGHEIIRVSKTPVLDHRMGKPYNGRHEWHTDGEGGEEYGGIAGQMWLLAQKNASSPEVGRHQTNLQVVPSDAFERYIRPLPRHCQHDWKLLDEISCTPALDEGDAVFYKGNVRHQTQDTQNDREAFSFDVDRIRVDGRQGRRGDHRRDGDRRRPNDEL